MALPPFVPETTDLYKVTDIQNNDSFPFDDIVVSGNVIPASILQNLMPPLEVHMNLNYPYKDQEESNSQSESDNEYSHYPKPPKHNPVNEFPPTLSRRIEIAEKRKKKKKKKTKTDIDDENERTNNFVTAPKKAKPLDTLCARSLEMQHGWKQTLFPGSKIITNHHNFTE